MENKKNNPYAWKQPESKKNKKVIPRSVSMYLCQCKGGHVFDYRERIRYPNDMYSGFAPCQGMCPICGSGSFSFIDSLYPIKYNFLG